MACYIMFIKNSQLRVKGVIRERDFTYSACITWFHYGARYISMFTHGAFEKLLR